MNDSALFPRVGQLSYIKIIISHNIVSIGMNFSFVYTVVTDSYKKTKGDRR